MVAFGLEDDRVDIRDYAAVGSHLADGAEEASSVGVVQFEGPSSEGKHIIPNTEGVYHLLGFPHPPFDGGRTTTC